MMTNKTVEQFACHSELDETMPLETKHEILPVPATSQGRSPAHPDSPGFCVNRPAAGGHPSIPISMPGVVSERRARQESRKRRADFAGRFPP